MRRIVTIPPALMRVTGCDWDIDWRGQSAGESNDGVTTIVYNRFPRWVGTPALSLRPAEVNAWRAIRAMAQGRAGVYRVPMLERDHLPRLPQGVPFSTGARFASGQGFAFTPFVTCAVAAPAGAEEILVTEADQPAAVGQFLSHDDWPMLVTWRAPEGALVRLGVQMPLRRPIPAGAAINLRATGLFEASDELAGNPAYGLVKVATPQLALQEWINRP